MQSLLDSIIASVLAGAMTLWGMAFAQPTLYVAETPNVSAAIVESIPETIPETIATSTPAASPVAELPSRLFIPSLEINAHIQHVGLTAAGAMASPKGFVDAGWYKKGVIPGQEGGAVLDGHKDNGLALPGVFKNLETIATGADIYIVTASSTTLHFVVTDVTSYDYKNTPNEEVFNDKGPGSRIRLITCVGDWVKGEKTYDERLVVTAEFISPASSVPL